MAHFDSLKNEAMWEREMKKLRSERDYRRENKASFLKMVQENKGRVLETSYRRKSSLKELIRAEEMSRGIYREEKLLSPEISKSAPEKEPAQKGAM